MAAALSFEQSGLPKALYDELNATCELYEENPDNAGIRGYAMMGAPVLHTVDMGTRLISLQQTTGSIVP